MSRLVEVFSMAALIVIVLFASAGCILCCYQDTLRGDQEVGMAEYWDVNQMARAYPEMHEAISRAARDRKLSWKEYHELKAMADEIREQMNQAERDALLDSFEGQPE